MAIDWAIFEHFYAGMVAEPPLLRDPLHIAHSASDSTAHEQLFPEGVKRYLFSHCSRTLGEKLAYL